MPETTETSLLIHALLDRLPGAAALFRADDTLIAANSAYSALPRPAAEPVLPPHFPAQSRELALDDGSRLCRYALPGGVTLVQADPAMAPELAMLPLFHALREGQPLFQAVVSAVQRTLGWRWVGVTRFLPTADNDCGSVDVLVLWDSDHFGASFQYEIAGMPCAVVLEKREFCRFDEVADLFPADTMAHDIGARTYAGKIYTDDSGQPLGHLFALHDSLPPADTRTATLFNVMTALLGAEWRALDAETELHAARAAARTDALTGLWNRRAFDEDIANLLQQQRRHDEEDAVMMLIDLDGMKQINDSLGHDAGDRMLALFGQQLATGCRRSDRAYRFGGDEFAVLLSNAVSPAVLQTRLNYSVQKLREAGFTNAGASAGIAALSEAQGDKTRWFALADARLYQMKQQHHRFEANG